MSRVERKRTVVTIKDIAREVGVSIATVSWALTGMDGMSQETRERILETASRLNYHPNLQARSLVAKKPDVIGIVIPPTSLVDFSNPFYAETLKGLEKKATESGQYLIFSFLREESYTKIYQHSLTAGVVILANRVDDPRIDEARKMKIPMVLIPGYPRRQLIPSVNVDNVDGAFKAVDHLAGLGHQRIAFLRGPMNSRLSIERFLGYRKALERNHLLFEEELIAHSDFSQQRCYAEMGKLLSMKRPPTAVFVINDFCALSALEAAKRIGYRVPEDVSIIGFGDIPFATMTHPPLTTIRAPYQQMGYEAMAMLLKLIGGKKLPKRDLILPVEMVIRESTAALSKSGQVISY